jgi:hypothetical protein
MFMDPNLLCISVGQGMEAATPRGQYSWYGHVIDVEVVGQYVPARH